MKVLFINNHWLDHKGGAELNDYFLAHQLQKKGLRLHYLILNSKTDDYSVDYEYTVLRKAFNLMQVFSLLTYFKPDVVYYGYLKNFLLPYVLICKLLGIKIIFRVNSINDVKAWHFSAPRKCQNFTRFLYRCTVALFMAIICSINHLSYLAINGVSVCQNNLLNYLKSKKVSAKCIYNMIIPGTGDNFEWRRPFIVWVANLKDGKNPHLYLEVARRFVDSHIDFLMIGKIQDRKYKFFEDSEYLPKNFIYLGPKDFKEVDQIVKASLFLVHTCNPEGFGMNFIQAWMQQKCTVSLYFDPDNLIENYQVGFCSKDFDKFICHIKALADNENARKVFEKNTNRLIDDKFDIEKIVQQNIIFFKEVVNG